MRFHLQIIDFVAHVMFPLNQVIEPSEFGDAWFVQVLRFFSCDFKFVWSFACCLLYLIEIGRKHVLVLTFVPYLCWYED